MAGRGGSSHSPRCCSGLKPPSPLDLSHPKPPFSPALTGYEPVACSAPSDSAPELRGGINSEREELASAQPRAARPGHHPSAFPREYRGWRWDAPHISPPGRYGQGKQCRRPKGWLENGKPLGWFIQGISMGSGGFGGGLEVSGSRLWERRGCSWQLQLQICYAVK